MRRETVLLMILIVVAAGVGAVGWSGNEDAVYAWKTGEFEGQSLFQAEDPGRPFPA